MRVIQPFALIDDIGQVITPAALRERTSRSVDVAMNRFCLRALTRTIARREESDPSDLRPVALDRPAAAVKIVTLADLRMHNKFRAERLGNTFGELESLHAGRKISVRDEPQHLAQTLDSDSTRVAVPSTQWLDFLLRKQHIDRRHGGIAQDAGETHPVHMHRHATFDTLSDQAGFDLIAIQDQTASTSMTLGMLVQIRTNWVSHTKPFCTNTDGPTC